MIDKTTFTILINLLNIIFILYLIFIERKNYRSLILWIITFISFPILGWIIFIMLGRGPKLKKNYISSEISEMTYFNSIKYFTSGRDFFSDLVNSINSAKESIHIESYIFRDDVFTKELIILLIRKLKEGVKVRIVIDSNGNMSNSKKQFDEFKLNGGEIYSFYKGIYRLLNFNYRNHKKIIVIDGKIGYLGGFNIGDEYLSHHPRITPWRDSQIRIEGEVVYNLQKSFLDDFYYAKNRVNKYENYNLVKGKVENKCEVKLIHFSPKSEYKSIKEEYMKKIYSAKKEIIIQTPYFVPDIGLLNALKSALYNKIKVKIMIPKVYDQWIPYCSTLEYAKELYCLGAEVYFYKGFIHAKTLIIDEEYLSLGSANFDIRSMHHNFEITAIISSKKEVLEYLNIFYLDLENSEVFDLVYERKYLKKYKIGRKVFKLLSTLM